MGCRFSDDGRHHYGRVQPAAIVSRRRRQGALGLCERILIRVSCTVCMQPAIIEVTRWPEEAELLAPEFRIREGRRR